MKIIIKIVESINYWILEILHIIIFFERCISNGARQPFKYRKTHSGNFTVLANGPSLKHTLATFKEKGFPNDTEYSVMNFFAFTPEFCMMKPRYYCLADPMFCRENFRINDVRKLYSILQNDVDWPMKLFIPRWFLKENFSKMSNLTNPNIEIIVLNSRAYEGQNKKIKMFLYKSGLSLPCDTVAQVCIYIGINMGYDKINLYGMEHTFFKNLIVDKECRLCSVEEHFYENKHELKPLLRNINGQQYLVSEYMLQMGKMFETHDILNEYADRLGCKILNYTPETMIDSYERIS